MSDYHVTTTGRIVLDDEPPQDGQVLSMQGGTFHWAPMGGSENTLFVSGGWCAPSATFADVTSGLDDEDDEVLASVPRGGVTINYTLNNEISPQVYRVLSGYPFPPPQETLL